MERIREVVSIEREVEYVVARQSPLEPDSDLPGRLHGGEELPQFATEVPVEEGHHDRSSPLADADRRQLARRDQREVDVRTANAEGQRREEAGTASS
jgi:hypothetical protein